MYGLIDPPGLYAPRKELEEFLQRVEALPQDDVAVQAAVSHARFALDLRDSKIPLPKLPKQRPPGRTPKT